MSDRKEMVVKSNRLVEASYRLTLAEQRIVLLAIVRARETGRGLNATDFVPVSVKDYVEHFGADEKSAYAQIKEAGQTLFYREFILYDTHPETGHERVTKARWVSAASYIDGAGVIQLQFSGVIVPYITRLEAEFTRYKLEKVAKMSSAYAIRLYELLMQWGSVGKREIELEWLKKALMVDKDYGRLDNFKKRVLDVALSQINEHSDLAASYSQRKTGRNVTHLTFTFAPKEDAEPKPAKAREAPADAPGSALFERLRGHGIGPRVAASWIRQDEGRALAAAEYVEARARAGLVKGPAAGYLRTVFESGADLGPSAFDARLEAEKAQAQEAARRAEEQARRQASEAKRAEEERRRRGRAELDHAMARFEALPAGVQNALEAQFMAESQGVDADLFRKKGRTYTGFRLFVKKAMDQGSGQTPRPAPREFGKCDLSWLDEPDDTPPRKSRKDKTSGLYS